MSTLRSALEEFRSGDLSGMPDARIEKYFAELQYASEVIEAERLRLLGEIDRRGTFTRDGHLSAASWLAPRFRVEWSAACAQVRMARSLMKMPLTTEALARGEISSSAAKALVAARETHPEAFELAEGALVQAAREVGVGELRRVVAYWEQAVDADRTASEKRWDARRLYVSSSFYGMVRVDGDLDPETGETVMTALRSVLDAEARSGEPDGRTPAQRRADALGEICRQHLDRADRPTVGGERPHLTVMVDVDVLRGEPGRSELENTGPIHPEVVTRLACDASITRVLMAGSSEPLDVGRRTPVVSPAMRRAVIARDGHCRFPSCDLPPSWCDAHHMKHWAKGGTTSVGNLVLLCRKHHRLVHLKFVVEMVDGQPVFTRADGSLLEERAPPGLAA